MYVESKLSSSLLMAAVIQYLYSTGIPAVQAPTSH